ncbi:MAG: hypothetical protein HYU43_05185 [Armatimonadetes bacterium]|nr:hypothetical protein [Armatimonadota bacterium]MBI2247926.1 hypothetical protein [Armatimonadota bacterium]MBI2972195.1 hypothetical protein [Armatimonadota bacterium]
MEEGAWSRIVGIKDLMEKAGLDPNNKEDFNRTVNWLRSRKIPFASIGKAVRGRQRGILVLADHIEVAIKKGRGGE